MSALLLATLGVVCPSCDELNPPKSTACKSCGHALEAPPARSAPAPAPVAAPRPAPPAGVPLGAAPRTNTQTGAPRLAPTVPPVAAVSPALAQASAPAVPPGMRPTSRPAPVASFPGAPAQARPAGAPVPASELTRKPPTVTAAPPPQPGAKLGLQVISGSAVGQRFRLTAATVAVGKSRGTILFPEDPFVSAHHATLLLKDGKLVVRDEQSTSGVFVAVAQETLRPGMFFSAGRRLFRYLGAAEAPPTEPGRPIVYGAPVPMSQSIYVLEEILVGGRPGRAVTTAGALLTIGQAACDLSYGEDPGMAPRHCELSPTPGSALLRDLSGGLGTYVRISGERALNPGDRVRVGDQVMQVEVLA